MLFSRGDVSSGSFAVDQDFAGRQIIGSREEQQDAYAFSVAEGDLPLLLVLADGMGGHKGGRDAANAAVQGLIDGFHSYRTSENEPRSCLKERLKSALDSANKSVDELIRSDEATLLEAGTTLLALACSRSAVHWISVGDSPLFLWRKKKLERLNEDHSMRAVLARKVAEGQMSPGDVDTHPERNVLLSALIGLEPQKIDAPSDPFPLESGDILLAASDGILSLTARQIEEVLKKYSKKPASEIVRILLDKVAALKVAKQDNATIAVVKV